MRIQLTSIHVSDPIEAFQFYTRTLGFIEQTFIPEANLAIVASPEHPDGTGLLLEPNDSEVAREYQKGLFKRNLPAIVLGVDDVEEEYQRLRDEGVSFRKEPYSTEWGVEAIFEDGFGNLVQLAQLQ